jgi:hypothetical protein
MKEGFRRTPLILLFLLLITTLCSCGQNELQRMDGNIPRRVEIVVGANTYLPKSNWIFSFENGIYSDGQRKGPEDVKDELTEAIYFSPDFLVKIIGDTAGAIAYTLYDRNNEEIYYRNAEFFAPIESGEYILFIEAAWGTDDHYDGYQYYIKFKK